MSTTSSKCADCQALVGASRGTRPHAQLEKRDFRAVSSMLGPADETYYKCKVCGQSWLYETGSQGFGWIESSG